MALHLVIKFLIKQQSSGLEQLKYHIRPPVLVRYIVLQGFDGFFNRIPPKPLFLP